MDAQSTIADLAFLSDCRGSALVDRSGAVVWWCPERFDGDAWFARVLGRRGGVWTLTPSAVRSCERAYEEDSLVLRTRFVTETGVAELREGLLFAPSARGHDIGRDSPATLARSIRCIDGTVEISHRFEPRSAYGLVATRCERDGLLVRAHGSAASLTLVGGHDLERHDEGLGCQFALEHGEHRDFVCGWGSAEQRSAPVEASAGLEDTAIGWRSWSELHTRPEGLAADEISFAVRILQGLTYQRSGAIIAAPVTSLPETVGGAANWDYRYAWLRDSSLVVHALKAATCADEAERYLAWMARVAHDGEPVGETQAVFGVDGERILTETTLEHLDGFAGSRPVRIGNGAWEQRQLDVYGHILAAAGTYDSAAELDPVVQRFLCQVATRAARSWQCPDHGIWERRGELRHYTNSKLACWVALEQALSFSDALGEDRDPLEWAAQRDAVHGWLEHAWDERRQAFPAWPGTDEVDASMLLFVVNGFLESDDPRARMVVETVESELGRNGLLVRWSASKDGAFLLCSCWLAQALVELGELDRAQDIFERVVACGNDVGLLPEEIDPDTGEALGNVPLAISHAGLVAAATAIQTARDAGREATEGASR